MRGVLSLYEPVNIFGILTHDAGRSDKMGAWEKSQVQETSHSKNSLHMRSENKPTLWWKLF